MSASLSVIRKLNRAYMRTVWKNNKTNGLYVVSGIAFDATNNREGMPIAVYTPIGDSIDLFVRDFEEFKDKFKEGK